MVLSISKTKCAPSEQPLSQSRAARISTRNIPRTMHSQGAKLGVLVALNKATAAMERAAREAESVEAGGTLRPRVQIRRVEELLKGRKPTLRPVYDNISAAAAAPAGGRRDCQRHRKYGTRRPSDIPSPAADRKPRTISREPTPVNKPCATLQSSIYWLNCPHGRE